MDEVRCALVGIEGPSSDAFKKDKNDGYADAQLINYLYNRGVLMDLYNGRRGTKESEGVPKKS